MIKKAFVSWLLGMAAASAMPHELQANRATLVLRDQVHLSVTLFLNYSEVLHQVLLPRRSFQEFAVAYSAMRTADFEKELLRAESQLQRSLQLKSNGNEVLSLSNWNWPEATRVQWLLQERVMQATVAPSEPAHEEVLEIRLEATAQHPIAGLTATFPAAFKRVLLVSYRPNQVWVEPRVASGPIKF